MTRDSKPRWFDNLKILNYLLNVIHTIWRISRCLLNEMQTKGTRNE